MPKWCWDWQDADAKFCDFGSAGCNAQGRLCTAAEIEAGSGCPAGAGPASDKKGDCAAAGFFKGSGVPRDWNGDLATLPPVPSVQASVPLGVPPLTSLPAVDDTFFCNDEKAGEAHFCSEAEMAACHRGPKSEMPDGLKCWHVGVPWPSVCPPGFVVDDKALVANGHLPPCLPDPAACGAGPWPDMKLHPNPLYVSADTGDDAANGDKDHPFKTIGKAVKIVKTSQYVAVAAGTYNESLTLDADAYITGRCAAMVHVVGALGVPVVLVTGEKANKIVGISGVHFSGKGTGIRVAGTPSLVLLREVMVEGVAVAGLSVGVASSVSFLHSLIVGTLPSSDGVFGRGVEALHGAHLTLTDVRISGSRELGVLVSDEGTSLSAKAVLIDGTLAQASDGQAGRGIGVQNGAHATLIDTRLSGNRETGLYVGGSATTLAANGLLIDGTRSAEIDNQYGIGMAVNDGAQVTMQDVRLSGNREVGLLLSHTNSKIEALHLLVDGTLPRQSDNKFGRGINVLKGATLTLVDARLSGNRGVGLSLSGANIALQATRLLIDSTLPQQNSKENGRGLSVQFGAKVKLQNVRLTGNRELGLLVAGEATSLDASDLLVDGTLAQQSDQQFGWGIAVLPGAQVTLRDTRLSANQEVGLVIDGDGIALSATRLVVDGTLPSALNQQSGRGINQQLGAHAVLQDVRLSGNREMGLFVGGAGTALEASGLLVDGTFSQASDGHFGRGVGVQDGATVRLQAAKLIGNRESGMSVMFSAVANLIGVTVDATAAAGIDHTGGSGLWLLGKSTATILASAFRNNRGVALAAVASKVSARGCVLSSTNLGDYAEVDRNGGYTGTTTKLADGLLLNAAANSVIERCLVVGNLRAGILVESSSGVKVTNTLVNAAKGSYGLDLQHSADALDVFNAIFGAAVQDRAADAGLSLPRAPEAAVALPGK